MYYLLKVRLVKIRVEIFQEFFCKKIFKKKRVTTNMSKEFCPTCGYKTLERVVVTVDADGNKSYRGRRKPKSTKGLRVCGYFS